ncbi:MAG: hypothetical protein ACOCV9_05765 [Marinilabiliaceae bacterium]
MSQKNSIAIASEIAEIYTDRLFTVIREKAIAPITGKGRYKRV